MAWQSQTGRSLTLRFLFIAILVLPLTTSGKSSSRVSNESAPSDVESVADSDAYLTHISLDKPIYRPGELLRVRGTILNEASHRPLPDNEPTNAVIQVLGPKGDSVASGICASEKSVLGFQWKIPPEQPGGEYKIIIAFPWTGQPPAERTFDIRSYRAPRLKSQIKFLRDGYGPGDQVIANLTVERAEGGIPEQAPVTIVARVDSEEVYRGESIVDANGNCQARFALPEEIKRGEGTLAMIIDDGGAVETASKTIPILLQTVDVTLYPEGGDLVAGLQNRVYFEAFTPTGKPADLSGIVTNEKDEQVATFSSSHEGRGKFRFTPQSDQKYKLIVHQPAGIKDAIPLPEVKPEGVVLAARNQVTAHDEKVSFSLGSSNDGRFIVLLKQANRELDQREIEIDAGTVTPIQLDPGLAEGVLTVTVCDDQGLPLAERLVFRKPAKTLEVLVTADAERYVPGGRVRLEIETRNSKGEPVSGVVGLTVTDDSVLEMIEKREQSPRLPAMVLLENDVHDLADAHIYFDESNPLAEPAIDLLLGTQGWRRFATLELAEFLGTYEKKALRALAINAFSFAQQQDDPTDSSEILQLSMFADGFLLRDGRLAENERFRGIDEIGEAEQPDENAEDDQPEGAKEELAQQEDQNVAAREILLVERDALADREDAAFGDAGDFGIGAGGFGGAAFGNSSPIRDDFVTVRIYAHQLASDRQPGQRRDFTETLFWHAALETDDSGKATVEFYLNDSVTSFRAYADAFSKHGELGSGTCLVESVKPFYLEPKLPLEVSAGDRIRVPVGLANATNDDFTNALIDIVASDGLSIDATSLTSNVLADQRLREFVDVRVGSLNGAAEFQLNAQGGSFSDSVTRSISVKPRGFPMEAASGGLLEPNQRVRHEFEIPDDIVADSLSSHIVVYPTPLASLTEALTRLIQEPNGCFEQTSSTTYPLVMAQQYFMSHQDVDPSIIDRSSDVLERGYKRLLGFECSQGGFEWFGKDPGHDALTAYGLLQFTDMARVRYVDPEMLDRTRQWLLDQRDGKGGYARLTATYHCWLADPEIASTYNTWAMLAAGVNPSELQTEVDYVRSVARTTENSYVLALAANVLTLVGDEVGREPLLDKLSGLQSDSGSVTGATTSVVGSGGESLIMETTALALMAWLHDADYVSQVERSMEYLAEGCQSGRYGSTQATVLALKAIVEYDESRARPKAPGTLRLIVDGKVVGMPVAFDEENQGAIELPECSELMTAGIHTIEIEMQDGSRMPYSLAFNFYRTTPDSSADCKLHLEAKLADTTLAEGESTEANVVLINRSNQDVPSPMAIIGIPGGLEVRHDQLKELVDAQKIAAYEVKGREVVLYWRSLTAEERVELPLSLIAAIPGEYTGPASRAYLYYTDEDKQWLSGMEVEIIASE